MLGICLKRYLFTPTGEAMKRNTHIDIPIEIGLPHFIHDDNMDDGAAAFGNFKLSLQSIVCHRGASVYSGHYISLVRGSWPDGADKWLLFDDLAPTRIRAVEIDRALKEESPYLLFYQIQPIEGDRRDISRSERPPSYLSEAKDSAIGEMSTYTVDWDNPGEAGRPSMDESRRGRASGSRERRLSIAFTNTSTTSLAKTDDTNNSLGVVTRKDSRRSRRSVASRTHSRATSQNGGGESNKRLSSTFQRFAGKIGTPLASNAAGSSKAANELSAVVIDEPKQPAVVQVEPSAYAEMKDNVVNQGLDPNLPERVKNKLRKEVREKSREKSRGRSAAGNKIRKGERPDRECVVM